MGDPSFIVDKEKCNGCGSCIKSCAGMMLVMGEDNTPYMLSTDTWEGRGCWGCQHCMAVCPAGAISIEGKKPENSLSIPGPEAAEVMDCLMAYRRSHRRYLDKNVPNELIMHILKLCQNIDTGGCRQAIEFTVINDKEYLQYALDKVYEKLDEQVKRGEYPWNSGKEFHEFMKISEKSVRTGEMLLCGAPHLLMIHQYWPEVSNWNHTKKFELGMATAYFEMLCTAHGLGCITLCHILGIIDRAPELKEVFGIPQDHVCCAFVAFGYPDLQYKRGTQRDTCVIETLNMNGLTLVSGTKGGHYGDNDHLDEVDEVVVASSKNHRTIRMGK